MKKNIAAVIFLFANLLSASANSDSATSRVTTLSEHSDIVVSVAYSPDGKWIASGSWDGAINLYRNDSDQVMVQTMITHETAVTSLEFSRDSKHLVSGGNDFKVIIWGYKDSWTGWEEQESFKLHTQPVSSVQYGPGMKMVFSAGVDGKIFLRDLVKKREKTIDHKKPINNMTISSNRQFLYVADHSTVLQEYDMLGNAKRTFEGHAGEVLCVAYSPNRKYLVTGSADKTVIIWDLMRGKPIHTLRGHSWKVNAVAISSDSKYVISGGKEGACRLWDIESGEMLDSFVSHGKDVTSVAFSRDNQYAVIGMWQEKERGDYGPIIWKTGLESRFAKKTTPTDPKNMDPRVRKMLEQQKKGTKSPAPKPQEDQKSQKVIQKTDEVEVRIDN